ncbi:MAG: HAD-IA family hydrolase, partial [SAR86 cluster bacterium]|nr:HAD-IA family hydrolase [SAR86 cluster bacterium]
MIKLVTFDLDGTLLDTAQDFFLAVNTLRDKYGIEEADFNEVRSRISEGAISLASYAMRIDYKSDSKEELIEDGQLKANKDLELFRLELLDIYKKCSIKNTSIFEGIDLVLNSLNNRKVCWGIVTNKPRFFAEDIVEATLGIYEPAFLICPDDTGKRKPSPEGLKLACKKTNIFPEDSIYIGDHSIDIIAGKAAGMKTVAAAYGYVPI